VSALVDVSLPPLRIEKDPRGLVLAAVEKRGIPLFHARLSLPAGASFDPKGKTGLASFTSDLLRRGTAQRDANAIDALIEGMGAHLSVDVNMDECSLALTVPFELAAPALDALLEVALTPSFPDAEVELGRRQTISALQSDLDEPGNVAARGVILLGYGPDHPYGHPLGGSIADVESFTREDVLAFHAAHYRAQGALLSLCGDATRDELLAIARERLAAGRFAKFIDSQSGLSNSLASQSFLLKPRTGLSALVIHKPDSTQAQVRMVAPGLSRKAPDWASAFVANSALGGGFTSLLVDAIRVERGLSYSVSSRLAMNRHAGLTMFSSFTKNETLRQLLDVALEKMRGYAESGPSQEALEKSQRYLAGLFPFSLQGLEALAEQVSDAVLDDTGLEQIEKYRSQISAVTLAQAKASARALSPARDGAQIVIVGDAAVAGRALEGICPFVVKPLEEFA
jgi:zinc protease